MNFEEEPVLSFFFFFSRLECSLKRVPRYLTSERWGNAAEADWDKFANDLGKDFFNSIKDKQGAAILFEQPPEKQIRNDDGSLGWDTVESPNCSQDLFGAIRRVRNNLFHGGKYSSGPIQDPSRNQKLLEACIFVLEEALKNSKAEKVRNYFDEPIHI